MWLLRQATSLLQFISRHRHCFSISGGDIIVAAGAIAEVGAMAAAGGADSRLVSTAHLTRQNTKRSAAR